MILNQCPKIIFSAYATKFFLLCSKFPSIVRKLKTAELNRISIAEFKSTDKIPLILVLDNVRSQNNIGSIFRTADAYLVKSIYLCGYTATPPNKEIHKTALGATDSVDWKYFGSTAEAVQELKQAGVKVFAIEQAENSISINDFSVDQPSEYAMILGNEVNGVDDEILEVCDGCIEIPQFGTKHSLNVSITAGIIIWDFFNKSRK